MKIQVPMNWLDQLDDDAQLGRRRLAVLVDPQDAPSGSDWRRLVDHIQASAATDVFVGGSLVTDDSTKRVVHELKRSVSQPVVLFPGAPNQVVPGADALLFLSLISGRNPDLLIGRHVEAASKIARLDIDTVPTGYMLIGDPPLTAAAYMSHTLPIPISQARPCRGDRARRRNARASMPLPRCRKRRGKPPFQWTRSAPS